MQEALSQPTPRGVSRELPDSNCDLRSRKQIHKEEAEGKISSPPFFPPSYLLPVPTIGLTPTEDRIELMGAIHTGQTPGHGAR